MKPLKRGFHYEARQNWMLTIRYSHDNKIPFNRKKSL